MSESSEQGMPSDNRNKRGQETGGLHFIKNLTVEVMAPSRLPTESKLGYTSETAFFGSKLRNDESGQMYLDFSGVMPAVDRTGDRFSRMTDDHVMKDPVSLMKRHPKLFVEHLTKGPKRYRGHISEIWANVQRLGLTDQYGAYHDKNGNLKGISFKENFIDHGRTIRNMYRAKRGLLEGDGAKEFDDVDRFQTLASATQFIRTIHDEHGGIGEVNADDVIFTELEENKLGKPAFSVPDIVYPDFKPNIEWLQIQKASLEIQHEDCVVNSDTNGARKISEQIQKIDGAINNIIKKSGGGRI